MNGPVLLGKCQAGELPTPDGVGRFNHFERGSIYWTPTLGAHVVMGQIRIKWEQLGWERSVLGYPLTDELATPDGVGRYNHFQNGSIYWTPTTGAHEVHGPIRAKWESMGWETGALGYPGEGRVRRHWWARERAPEGHPHAQHRHQHRHGSHEVADNLPSPSGRGTG